MNCFEINKEIRASLVLMIAINLHSELQPNVTYVTVKSIVSSFIEYRNFLLNNNSGIVSVVQDTLRRFWNKEAY